MFLLNKTENPNSWKDLRPISFIPAILAILEKISLPLVREITKPLISKFQFGFKEGSSCNLVKLRISYLANQKGHNKILLIDLAKAFDSVRLDYLQSVINNSLQDPDQVSFLSKFITIYKNLEIDLNGYTLRPENGVPQGATLSPIFFNIIIDPIIRDLRNLFPNIDIGLYADDIEVQSNNIQILTEALRILQYKLIELNLHINFDKCVLISKENSDKIVTPIGTDITAVTHSKYLGQYIDSSGKPLLDLNQSNFGKLIHILKENSGLTRYARIKIFKI